MPTATRRDALNAASSDNSRPSRKQSRGTMAGTERPPRTTSRPNSSSGAGRVRTASGGGSRPRVAISGRGGQKWHSDWKIRVAVGTGGMRVAGLRGGWHRFRILLSRLRACGGAASSPAAVCQYREDLCGSGEVRPDQKYSVQEIAHELNQAGYSPVGQSHPSQMGTYSLTETSIHIQPGPQSYHAPDGATVYTA